MKKSWMELPVVRHLPGEFRTETPREQALGTATTMITNLLRCVLWLIRHGIYVIGFKGDSANGCDRIVIRVTASSHLQKVFNGQYGLRERRPEGAIVITTWYSLRFGCVIEWEEVCAASSA